MWPCAARTSCPSSPVRWWPARENPAKAAMDARKYFLEDLTVGQTFRSGTHRITAEEIIGYARQFDPQPFHLSDDGAKGSVFGSLAASGWHTAAITMRLNVESGLPLAGGVI